MSITVKTNTLLLESGDEEIDRFLYIFEEAINGGYLICTEMDELPYGNIFENMLNLRALSDEEMMRYDDEVKTSELNAFRQKNPHATIEEIGAFEEEVDEELCYDRSYTYGQEDETILEAAMELGYCLMSTIDITWDKESGYPKFVEIDVFNCPQRNVLEPFKEELGSMSFGLTIRR